MSDPRPAAPGPPLPSSPARLVLVGGGHAHLGVLAAWAEAGPPGAPGDVLLVSEDRYHWYSGRVPAHLRGDLAPDALRFDLAALARAAGVGFVEARVEAIREEPRDPAAPPTFVLELEAPGPAPRRVEAAALSLDVGSAPRGTALPGVAEHALGVRPMARARALRERTDVVALGRPDGTEVPAVVVGGGAAGVEVALALHARIRRLDRTPAVRLLEAGPHLLPGWPVPTRLRALRILKQRGVEVVTESRVVEVERHAVRVERSGETAPEPTLLTVWLTGAAPPPLLAASDLPLDADGYLEVDTLLRATDGRPIWGAGDCVAIAGHPPLPKAGVQPVRQGPVLAANLAAHLAGEPAPEAFEPDPVFLHLLDTSDGKALLRWRRLHLHTRWARWLKDRIDGRFVARLRALEADPPPPSRHPNPTPPGPAPP